jgi:hypothetical protein
MDTGQRGENAIKLQDRMFERLDATRKRSMTSPATGSWSSLAANLALTKRLPIR